MPRIQPGIRATLSPVFRIAAALYSEAEDLFNVLVHRKRHGVKVLLSQGGSILLVRHAYGSGRWTFPGGKSHKGEQGKETARREMAEELALDISPVWFGEYETNRHGAHDIIQCFMSQLSSADFALDPVEILDARWFSVGDLPDPLSPTVRHVLDLYRAHFHTNVG